MKRIKLTQNKYALVDDEDYEKLSKYKWYCLKMSNRYQYAFTTINSKDIQMASMIMNPPDKCRVVHLDKNGLNNQKYNLRILTFSQKSQNQIKGKGHYSSKYKGVSIDKVTRKWRSHITINGKNKYLGRYDSEEEAAKAYDSAAKQYFGEFAQLNFYEDT